MSGVDCFARASVCKEPSGASKCRRDRLPSMRTLKRNRIATSGPVTVACNLGVDSIRIACAHAGWERPVSNSSVRRIDIDGPASTRRNLHSSLVDAEISSAWIKDYYATQKRPTVNVRPLVAEHMVSSANESGSRNAELIVGWRNSRGDGKKQQIPRGLKPG